MSKTFTAVATLIGTIIGAGILGIPYVVMRAGFLVGVINMILVAGILLMIYLYLGEISLRTKANLHISGYAGKYLGKKGKIFMFIAFASGIYASLIAYLIGEGESLSYLFFETTKYSLYFGIGFWILLSAMTFFGLKALKEGEKIGIVVIFLLISLIVVLFWNKIDVSNLTYNNSGLFYVPFGVVMFAFLGFASIPEVERILQKKKNLMKRTILISVLVALVIYVVFAAVVLGSQGSATPQIATLALGKIFVLLGMFAMFTSYLAVSTALIDTFRFDFKQTKNKSWLYAILIPLAVFVLLTLIKRASFIKIIGIGGVISGCLTGALILLMVKKARKLGDRKPEYCVPYSKVLTWVIILVLGIGAVLEILGSF